MDALRDIQLIRPKLPVWIWTALFRKSIWPGSPQARGKGFVRAKTKLLGSDEPIQWSQGPEALTIKPPRTKPYDHAIVFNITPKI